MEGWINIHTHKPGRGLNVVDPCLGGIVEPGDGVVFYSMGIHPMYIDESAGQRLKEIAQAAKEGEIVAVGEAGLDRNSPVALEVQTEWFERQAEIASRYELPLIIHGVRAIPEIITMYKKQAPSCKWIMHGFNNRREILQEVLRHGLFISAGWHVMNDESNIYCLLPEIPTEQLFIETDNSDFTIEEIYRKVAERRKVSVEQLQRQIRLNFERVFGKLRIKDQGLEGRGF